MRLKLQITGLVQGVGFRPFVFKLAKKLGLRGYVLNNNSGVSIEVEGKKQKLNDFLIRVDRDKPDISTIFSLQHSFIENAGYDSFEIRDSIKDGHKNVSILPDISLCEECAAEITDPQDRRFMYLFTNCTNCGPRFTIIENLPYDRKQTSMNKFVMCHKCKQEYNRPDDRRFHAQPNACNICGPFVSLYDLRGNLLCSKEDALEKAINHINEGDIIAVKGLGGYHLICDATNEEAVVKLRTRKNRDEKPIAVMFPDLHTAKKEVHINILEERALTSVEKPILIVNKLESFSLAGSISPDNNTVGVFIPYTPLHYIMLKKLNKPVVATSANITDDPMLSEIADFLLIHKRGIIRRCDDSVVRIIADRQIPVRRSRGFAPVPVTLPFKLNKPVLALGPYMNNTIAVGVDDKVYLSQHIGDLDTPLAMEYYEETINDFIALTGIDPEVVVSDMHPGYNSTKYGEKNYSDKLVKIQHHFAHILSCMAENGLTPEDEVIGFAFDGTGYGTDKTIWGGEVLIASYMGFRRALHLRPYRLPGGDKAVKEPCRTALSLLYDTFGDKAYDLQCTPFQDKEKALMIEIIKKNINCPVTTSMGRLFDAVASIIGLQHKISYHAQAAIALEQLAAKSDDTDAYPFVISNNMIYQLPVIDRIVDNLTSGISVQVIAKRFHNTIVHIILEAAVQLRNETGISHVALTGGVFQNSILMENALNQLEGSGFTPLVHQLVPPNDGGISLGQAVYSNCI
jgi:hydrogenase maturation protein HypF